MKNNQQNKPEILNNTYLCTHNKKQIMPINLDPDFASTYMLNNC